MRILKLEIKKWRNFKDVSFEIPEDAKLVCLVGENGTGKSNILELISALANQIGLSPGVEISRGNPMEEPHNVSWVVKFSGKEALFGEEFLQKVTEQEIVWDGTVKIESENGKSGHQIRVTAGGTNVLPKGRDFVRHDLIRQLQQRPETHYLYLDADRSYPPRAIEDHEYAQGMSRQWESRQWSKNRAFQPTRTMYGDWINYFLSKEGQEATQHFQKLRKAKELNAAAPEFVDHFASYKASVKKVLPHLNFEGVDQKTRTLVFDSAGVQLNFNQLSGGEREIAFLIGQIERFKLRHGLFLIDEPELHLNSDLIRVWISFLRDTVENGQTWIATHSLEAVEVAGNNSVFVLERSGPERVVNKTASLKDRPVLSVLSSALGSPAFSLTKLRFVFVEGERDKGERERFHKICGDSVTNRFMEAGNCHEVARKLAAVNQLAKETEQNLRLGGIIDRDFRTPKKIDELAKFSPVYVLPCHEIENLFLHPPAIAQLIKRNAVETPAEKLIQQVADSHAGGWIFQRAYTQVDNLPEPSPVLKSQAWKSSWSEIAPRIDDWVASLFNLQTSMPDPEKQRLKIALTASANAYERARSADDFWKACMGKQVAAEVSRKLGFQGPEFLEANVLHLWSNREVPVAQEVTEVRNYVNKL